MSQKQSKTAISTKALKVLTALAKIKGSNTAARKQAQPLISKLAGERCTKRLVSALREILRARNWGVRCFKDKCGQASAIGWERSKSCLTGGTMYVQHHNPKRRSSAHTSAVVMPDLRLVPYQYPQTGRSVPMSQNAEQFLAAIAEIQGTNAAAMKKAQVLLDSLASERCTRALVLALKKMLSIRDWGFRCLKDGCAEPASIGWTRHKSCKEGEVMCLRHKDNQRNWLQHQCLTTLPRVVLVEYRNGHKPSKPDQSQNSASADYHGQHCWDGHCVLGAGAISNARACRRALYKWAYIHIDGHLKPTAGSWFVLKQDAVRLVAFHGSAEKMC